MLWELSSGPLVPPLDPPLDPLLDPAQKGTLHFSIRGPSLVLNPLCSNPVNLSSHLRNLHSARADMGFEHRSQKTVLLGKGTTGWGLISGDKMEEDGLKPLSDWKSTHAQCPSVRRDALYAENRGLGTGDWIPWRVHQLTCRKQGVLARSNASIVRLPARVVSRDRRKYSGRRVHETLIPIPFSVIAPDAKSALIRVLNLPTLHTCSHVQTLASKHFHR